MTKNQNKNKNSNFKANLTQDRSIVIYYTYEAKVGKKFQFVFVNELEKQITKIMSH